MFAMEFIDFMFQDHKQGQKAQQALIEEDGCMLFLNVLKIFSDSFTDDIKKLQRSGQDQYQLNALDSIITKSYERDSDRKPHTWMFSYKALVVLYRILQASIRNINTLLCKLVLFFVCINIFLIICNLSLLSVIQI